MMPIESAFQIALTERAGELAIWATKPALSADGSEAWAEQAFANIYADYVVTKQRLSDSIEDPSTRTHLAVVDSASEKAYAGRTLPDEIFTNNMYVHLLRRLDSSSTSYHRRIWIGCCGIPCRPI